MSIWTEAVRLCGFNAYESDIKSFIVKTIPKNASSFCKCCIDKLNAKRTKTFNSKLRYLNSTDFWVGDIEDYHDVEEKLSSYKDITM